MKYYTSIKFYRIFNDTERNIITETVDLAIIFTIVILAIAYSPFEKGLHTALGVRMKGNPCLSFAISLLVTVGLITVLYCGKHPVLCRTGSVAYVSSCFDMKDVLSGSATIRVPSWHGIGHGLISRR